MHSISRHPNLLAAFSLVSFLSVSALGCAPPAPADPEAEARDDGEAALGANLKCDVTNLGAPACQDALASVRLQAYAVGRSDILERGINWVSLGILYDAGKYFQGWRRDCSGFISMVWNKANPGTASLPPFVTTSQYARELGGFDELVPGDAINRKTRYPNKQGVLVGHVMMFAGWASDDHQLLYIMDEYSPGKPTELARMSRSSLSDYIAIRSLQAPEPTAPSTDPTPAPDPAPTPAPTPGCGKLVADQSLGIDQSATSCDGRFTLVNQGDGNLVLYMNGNKPLWSTSTFGASQTTVMQEDGNLVIYGPSGPVWSTQTNGNPGAWLAIHDDGSLVVEDANGKPIWWEGTGGL